MTERSTENIEKKTKFVQDFKNNSIYFEILNGIFIMDKTNDWAQQLGSHHFMAGNISRL